MKKNKPLQCARKIWQVLSIGAFLFCACFFFNTLGASAAEGQAVITCTVKSVGFTQSEGNPNNLLTAPAGNMTPYWSVENLDNGGEQVIARSFFECYFSGSGLPTGSGLITFKPTSRLDYLIAWSPNSCSGTNCRSLQLYNYASTFLPATSTDYGRLKPSSGYIGIYEEGANMPVISDQIYLTANNREWIGEKWAAGYGRVAFAIKGLMDNGGSGDSDTSTIIPWRTYNQNYWMISSTTLVLDYEYIEEPTTPDIGQSGLTVGDIQCCVDTMCAVPLSYSEELNDVQIAWGVDLDNCNFFSAEQKNTMTLDIYSGSPIYFPASSTLAAGNHSLCLAYSIGDYSAIVTKPFNVLTSTSTICAGMDVENDIEAIWCNPDVICADTATSTSVWSGLTCAGKKIACWLFSPLPGSFDFLSERFDAVKTKAPFSLYFNITDSLEEGFATSTNDKSGSIGLPMWSASSSSFYFITVLDGSSTEKAIGSENADLFRNTQIFIIWACVAGLIIIFLIKQQ